MSRVRRCIGTRTPACQRRWWPHRASQRPSRVEADWNDIEVLRARVEGLLAATEAKGDTRGAVTAIREGTRLIELIGKMQGALTPPPAIQINLHQSTSFRSSSAM
jgi:hypothetical protein